jgi:hypothetical protein
MNILLLPVFSRTSKKIEIYLLVAVVAFLLGGCTIIKSEIESSLIESNDKSPIVIYYQIPDNFILKAHAVSISIDGQPYFFLKKGEQIRFFLEHGNHIIEVSPLSSHFDYKEEINIDVIVGKTIYLKTYPVFEGTTFIPYWFIPLPAVDIRFKLNQIDEELAHKEINGTPIDTRKRAFKAFYR